MEQKNNIKTIISNVIAALLYVIAVIFWILSFKYFSLEGKDENEMMGYLALFSYLKVLIFVISGFGCAILGRMFQKK